MHNKTLAPESYNLTSEYMSKFQEELKDISNRLNDAEIPHAIYVQYMASDEAVAAASMGSFGHKETGYIHQILALLIQSSDMGDIKAALTKGLEWIEQIQKGDYEVHEEEMSYDTMMAMLAQLLGGYGAEDDDNDSDSNSDLE